MFSMGSKSISICKSYFSILMHSSEKLKIASEPSRLHYFIDFLTIKNSTYMIISCIATFYTNRGNNVIPI